MNIRRILLISLVSSVVAMAQTAPPSQKVAPSSHRARKASPMASKAKAPARAASPAKAKSRPVEANTMRASKRDPFVSPIREVAMGGPGCSVGKKCLAADTVVLRGVASTPGGAIAVVENPRTSPAMTYFLRENDPVFNGFVVKITPDSIVFRENVMDRVGNQTTRDIVKKVAPAA